MEKYKDLYPLHWESRSLERPHNAKYRVAEETEEYKKIRNTVQQKLINNKPIASIHRIENKHAYISMMIKKDKYIYENGAAPSDTIHIEWIENMCTECIDKNCSKPLDSRKSYFCYCSRQKEDCAVLFHVLDSCNYPQYLIKFSKQ